MNRVETELLTPAQELLGEVISQHQQLIQQVAEASDKVVPVAQAAAASWNILSTVAPDHPALQELYERLAQLHERCQATTTGHPQQPEVANLSEVESLEETAA